MTVDSILSQKGSEVTKIAPDATLKTAADWLRAKNIGALVVTSGDSILGIVSERDIVRAFSQYGQHLMSMFVKDIMQQALITVKLDDSLDHAMKVMTHYRVRHLPVVQNRKLVGIISIGDVVKNRLNDLQMEADILRDAYIARR